MVTTLSSSDFHQDSSRATRAAETGPVIITDRGIAAHVLLNIEEYRRLARGDSLNIIHQLGLPAGVEDVELEILPRRDLPDPAAEPL